MAFTVNGHGPQRTRGRYRPLAEINVTPLVDVMLVLLIIFMVTAPLITSGVTVDLPHTKAAPVNQDATPITLSIKADGRIYLQNTEISLSSLVARVKAIANAKPDRRIFVRGDRAVPYGRVVQVMGALTSGGFTKVALLAQPPAGGSAPSPAPKPANGAATSRQGPG